MVPYQIWWRFWWNLSRLLGASGAGWEKIYGHGACLAQPVLQVLVVVLVLALLELMDLVAVELNFYWNCSHDSCPACLWGATGFHQNWRTKSRNLQPVLEYIVDGDSDKETRECTACRAVFCCFEFFGIRSRFMRTIAFYRATFLGDPQKIRRPTFWTNGIEKMILVQLLECVLGKARSMWNSVQTILVFGEYRKYTEYWIKGIE